MIRGIDGYMNSTGFFQPSSPYGMTGYKMREFDMIFHGDSAFVAFVADVDANTPAGPFRRTLARLAWALWRLSIGEAAVLPLDRNGRARSDLGRPCP